MTERARAADGPKTRRVFIELHVRIEADSDRSLDEWIPILTHDVARLIDDQLEDPTSEVHIDPEDYGVVEPAL